MYNSLLNESKIRTTLDAEYTKFKEAVMSGKAREYYELDTSIVPVENRSEYVNIVFQWYKDKMKSKNDIFKNKQDRVQHYVYDFLRSSTNSNRVKGYLLKRSEWDAIRYQYQKNGYVYKTQKERNNEQQAEQAKAKQNSNDLRKIESNYYNYKNNLNKLEKDPNAWENMNKNNLKTKSNQYKKHIKELLPNNIIQEKNQKLGKLLNNNQKLSPNNVKEACKILVPNSKSLIPRQTPYGLSRNTEAYQACKNKFHGHQPQGGKKAVPKKKPVAKKPVAKKPVKKSAPKKKPAAKKPAAKKPVAKN